MLRARPLELAAIIALAGAGQVPLEAQLSPPATGGIAALDFQLQQLAENRRVLVVGAHPDDEDTAFLAVMARGYGADAAYLSLCRGEGGQNLIGDELGIGLGILRTGELLAARSVDGARQFFTRAYDFGFSKSLAETSRFWNPDSILKDVVRVIRRFEPHVILSIFSGTMSDGHGHHHAAGVATRAAFEAAADPARFPELFLEEGLDPWAPLKLYQSAWLDSSAATLAMPTGGIETRSGRTFQQIAMASRSRHRSQDMGRPQPIGPASAWLRLLEDRTRLGGDGGEGDSLFLGIPRDSTWLAHFADSLRGEINPQHIAAAVEPLARAVERARRAAVSNGDRDLLAEALATSAGLMVDARAASPLLVPGEQLEVTVEVYNGGPYDVALQSLTVETPQGWVVEIPEPGVESLGSGGLLERRAVVTVPLDASPTEPYYLQRPLNGFFYNWSDAPPVFRGLPFQPPLLRVAANVAVSGATAGIEREVTYRYNDQAVGEQRLPLRVVPRIDVRLDPGLVVWPAGAGDERTFTVTLRHNGDGPVAGQVTIETEDLLTPEPIPFQFERAGESRVIRVPVIRPVGTDRARVRLRAVARTEDGAEHDHGVRMVAHPHIRPTPIVVEAVSNLEIASIAFPGTRHIGYLRGAADRIPEALQQTGLEPVLLTDEDLASRDLSRFDAIVVGSRAYETDAALLNHNARLLEYVRQGGHMLVLYQQYQFASGGFAPYGIDISRPHDRITDETAPVTILHPEHPVFTTPNRIGPGDWEGWPQELGLYFAGSWDNAYTPLLEMADPRSDPVRGGLLVAEYGNGTYVYTGLSFFRAIPAGVVGAYRLFMNLLNLGAEERR